MQQAPVKMNDEIKVLAVQKKQFGGNMPGSSPEQRHGIPDIQYQQKYGKAPLLEKRDSKYRKMAGAGSQNYNNNYEQ